MIWNIKKKIIMNDISKNQNKKKIAGPNKNSNIQLRNAMQYRYYNFYIHNAYEISPYTIHNMYV